MQACARSAHGSSPRPQAEPEKVTALRMRSSSYGPLRSATAFQRS